jgi:hypothetical protein
VFIAIKDDTSGDFRQQLVTGHVRLVIAVVRDVAFVSACTVVDDVKHGVKVFVDAQADHDWISSHFSGLGPWPGIAAPGSERLVTPA